MPLSYAHSQGDGVNKNFDVPCDYLSRTHVKVKVDGVDVSFNWIDTYRVQTVTAPPMGSVVEVRRTTPRVQRLVTFRDGSTLVETDLNVSTLQSFFLSQEAFDQGAASMAVTEDGQFSALNRRITLLADPVNGQDAVTKRWAETAMSSQLQQATQKAAAANSSATVAGQREAGAIAAANRADGSDSRATLMANKAEGHEKIASEKATSATASDVSAKASLTAAKGHEDKAKEWADAAAASAERVGNFDPNSYYKKPDADQKFATKEYADTKLNHAGGTLTGSLKGADSRGNIATSGFWGDVWGGSYADTIKRGSPFRVQASVSGNVFAPALINYYSTGSWAGFWTQGIINTGNNSQATSYQIFHMNADGLAGKYFTFTPSGEFRADGDIRAGSWIYAGGRIQAGEVVQAGGGSATFYQDGNLSGARWGGGYLYDWIEMRCRDWAVQESTNRSPAGFITGSTSLNSHGAEWQNNTNATLIVQSTMTTTNTIGLRVWNTTTGEQASTGSFMKVRPWESVRLERSGSGSYTWTGRYFGI